MNEENKNEIKKTPLSEESTDKVIGGNDPFADLPKVDNAPIDADVTNNG